MKYILFVIFPIAVMFGSFIRVVVVNEKVEVVRHAKFWNDIQQNYEDPSRSVFRRARDGLLSQTP